MYGKGVRLSRNGDMRMPVCGSETTVAYNCINIQK